MPKAHGHWCDICKKWLRSVEVEQHMLKHLTNKKSKHQNYRERIE
jgi:hypothetical protein